MAVPRGFSRGFLAAETGRSLPLFSRPLKQTRGAWPKGSTLPCTMQNTTLAARGASPREVAHAERRWRMHGGYKTHPRRGSAAAHGGKARFLRLWSEGGSHSYLQDLPSSATSDSNHHFGLVPQQRHVESPHLHSQSQTLSTANRVEQA
jgi:hypothetical protein